MTVESATNINELNSSLPADTDDPSEGAAQIRLLKTLLKAAGIGGSTTSVSADKGFVLTDANCEFVHPSTDASARTWTIPANASVAYPVGTWLAFYNENGAGSVFIAINTDTMRLAGSGSGGTRTLAPNGVAVAKKIGTTSWLISGTGLT